MVMRPGMPTGEKRNLPYRPGIDPEPEMRNLPYTPEVDGPPERMLLDAQTSRGLLNPSADPPSGGLLNSTSPSSAAPDPQAPASPANMRLNPPAFPDLSGQTKTPMRDMLVADAWAKNKVFGQPMPEQVTFIYDDAGNPIQESVEKDGRKAPVLQIEADRRKSITEDTPAAFRVAPNPAADDSDPFHRFDWVGRHFVGQHNDTITEEASQGKMP